MTHVAPNVFIIRSDTCVPFDKDSETNLAVTMKSQITQKIAKVHQVQLKCMHQCNPHVETARP